MFDDPLAYVSNRDLATADIIITTDGQLLKNRHGSREDRVLVVPTVAATTARKRVEQIITDMGFREGHEFFVGFFAGSDVLYVQHRYIRPDSITGELGWGYGRKWHVSPHATESEVVLTCLKAGLTNSEHEVREDFTYKGQHVFQPHIDINALVEASQHSDAREAPATECARAEVLG